MQKMHWLFNEILRIIFKRFQIKKLKFLIKIIEIFKTREKNELSRVFKSVVKYSQANRLSAFFFELDENFDERNILANKNRSGSK